MAVVEVVVGAGGSCGQICSGLAKNASNRAPLGTAIAGHSSRIAVGLAIAARGARGTRARKPGARERSTSDATSSIDRDGRGWCGGGRLAAATIVMAVVVVVLTVVAPSRVASSDADHSPALPRPHQRHALSPWADMKSLHTSRNDANTFTVPTVTKRQTATHCPPNDSYAPIGGHRSNLGTRPAALRFAAIKTHSNHWRRQDYR